MSGNFQPPPTYAEPVLTDEQTKKARFNPIWLKWFLDLVAFLNASGGSSGSVVHNNTTGKQGGGGTEFYHATALEYSTLQGWEGNQPARAVLCGPVSGAAAAPTFKNLNAIKYKNAGTSLASQTVLQNDPDLVFAIGANDVWIGRVFLAVGVALKTTGFQVTVVGPTGATGTFHASMITDASTGKEVDVQDAIALGSAANFTAAGLSNSNSGFCEVVFRVVNGANAGNVTIQWCQSTSSVTNTTVEATSQLKADRMA